MKMEDNPYGLGDDYAVFSLDSHLFKLADTAIASSRPRLP
jgi:hypothetical protein